VPILAEARNLGTSVHAESRDRMLGKLSGRGATRSQRPGKDDDLYMNVLR